MYCILYIILITNQVNTYDIADYHMLQKEKENRIKKCLKERMALSSVPTREIYHSLTNPKRKNKKKKEKEKIKDAKDK